jgi:hypothetical protein
MSFPLKTTDGFGSFLTLKGRGEIVCPLVVRIFMKYNHRAGVGLQSCGSLFLKAGAAGRTSCSAEERLFVLQFL